jgi:ethanolamine ammonia-lyase small subunit
MTPEKQDQHSAKPDPWTSLQSFTAARIALGRTGVSVPVRESLNFKLAHAFARDAVYSSLAVDPLQNALGIFQLPVYGLHSQARNRPEYLQRPDLGRRLNNTSSDYLKNLSLSSSFDVALILADGLSATAINLHAIPVLKILIPSLQASGISLAPVTIVEQGRVAISDEIGSILHARIAVIFIGERPGLSSPDSMGAYLTYGPAIGLTDASRNCISNIRPEGLPYEAAAQKILYLIRESLRLKLSGVQLKESAGMLGS